MPLESRSQQRWMFATHPEMAKQWAAETPDIKALPEKVGEPKPKKRRYYGEQDA